MEKRPEHRDGGVEWRVAMKPGRRRLLGEGVAEEAAEKRKIVFNPLAFCLQAADVVLVWV